MPYLLTCLAVFFLAYLVNMTYISVFYHRGLTHGALTLKPWLKRFVVLSGTMVTGLDPKPWCCMHRRHHLFSDKIEDPHSPDNVGVLGVLLAQKNEFGKTTWGLVRGEEKYTSLVRDLNFPVNWLSSHDLWWVPYATHLSIVLVIGFCLHAWWLGICYFFGMMSHPLQGWMVNAFGHAFGYRNFQTDDNSRNNLLVSALVMGEGYQNNHHQRPSSANFGYRWWEADFGYVLCRLASAFRLVTIRGSDIDG